MRSVSEGRIQISIALTLILVTRYSSSQIERSFNESCEHDVQCVDFRMKCSAERCRCVKYYHWDEFSNQCLTLRNLTYMLQDMKERYDPAGGLRVKTDVIFTSLVWTGVAVMVTGVLLAFACFFYTCCYQRLCRGDKTTRMTNGTVRETCGSSYSTVIPTGALRTKSATAEGPACDFIPGLYQTTSFNVI